MNSTIYKVLGTLAANSMALQILTSNIPTDFVLEGQKFVKQQSHYTLQIRTTKDFHDRFIVVDKARCYLLGASIKDAGNKSFTIEFRSKTLPCFNSLSTMPTRFGPRRLCCYNNRYTG